MTQKQRAYDLPLHKKAGTGFILWVLVLMSFLCAMTLAGSFFLSNITKDWEQSLTGQITIEIQAPLKQQGDDISIDTYEQQQIETRILETIKTHYPNLKAELIDTKNVFKMLDPWLGFLEEDDQTVQNILPLPSLIAVTNTAPNQSIDLEQMSYDLKQISNNISIDTHEKWLSDIVQLTHKIRNTGFLLALVIALTTITAVAGASRSRLTMHFSEIELLHFIGAKDSYIAKQFSRHAAFMTLEGTGVGIALAILSVFTLSYTQTSTTDALIPTLELTFGQWSLIVIIPFIACAIAYITSGITSRFFLRCMP